MTPCRTLWQSWRKCMLIKLLSGIIWSAEEVKEPAESSNEQQKETWTQRCENTSFSVSVCVGVCVCGWQGWTVMCTFGGHWTISTSSCLSINFSYHVAAWRKQQMKSHLFECHFHHIKNCFLSNTTHLHVLVYVCLSLCVGVGVSIGMTAIVTYRKWALLYVKTNHSKVNKSHEHKLSNSDNLNHWS